MNSTRLGERSMSMMGKQKDMPLKRSVGPGKVCVVVFWLWVLEFDFSTLCLAGEG